ncbi:MAG: Stp1/IreP family PP2C-type Ser/Thr phosphatase [Blastocatellia bacterium]|nr:Stp1/IreP family PP2C-type Ser/Thr phosphatase [Blastocatellia bacterium]MBN8725055.1 Stp1/IreP family PP2C-type Ser/Thr phosphatase [Acidobacteriota bacterium]
MPGKKLIKVRMYGKTDVGCVRQNNEDNFFMSDLVDGFTPLPNETLTRQVTDNRVLLAVADGMGGAAAGEVASELAINGLKEEFLHFPGVGSPERLMRAIQQINQHIWDTGRRHIQYRGMATTLTAALIEGNRAYIAEIGDSRAYILRGGRIKQITTDQSWLELMIEQGLMTREEAKSSKQRNMILQSLGGQQEVKVALTAVDLAAGDILLLCSDGLSEKISAPEMLTILRQSLSLEIASNKMVNLAKDRGGEDNITLVVAHFDGDGLEASPAPEELISYIKVINVFDHVADMGVRDTRKLSSEQRGPANFKTTIRVKDTAGVSDSNYPNRLQLEEQATALADYIETLQLALEQQLNDLDQYTEWQLKQARLDIALQHSIEGLKSAVPALSQLRAALNECNKNIFRATSNKKQ